jgi:hypothetical protein
MTEPEIDNSAEVALPMPDSLFSQRNWLALLSGAEFKGAFEYPLYSDTRITGEYPTGLGPYSFLNAVPLSDGPGNVNAPIIVRASIYLDQDRPSMLQKNESLYHGGIFIDEIAALTSLCLGARVRAGGMSRRFELGGDTLGRPCAWDDKPKPTVNVRRNRLVLPSVVGAHSLDKIKLLSSIPTLSPGQYVSLIRACKSYQDALWVAESEPNLAWLMLISAIETAANEFKASQGTPVDILRISKPGLVKILEDTGGEAHVVNVANIIAPTIKATAKFINFTLHFLPHEPEERPNLEWLRIDWSEKSLKEKILNKVYDYRSRALHGGIPFPAPMFEAPFYFDTKSFPSEKPPEALAYHSHGGTWLPDDIPINLHCFHYIARGALLNWWKSMAGIE